MDILISFLSKKTNWVGILTIALGIVSGDNQSILIGLGFISGRHAISKLEG